MSKNLVNHPLRPISDFFLVLKERQPKWPLSASYENPLIFVID